MVGDQADQASGTGYDLSFLSDITNRNKKLATQRQRNEMMRLGVQDPGAFALQNQQELQQAQQPTEFWGAGRKIAENQAPDLGAANAIAPLVKLGGDYNYYGNLDPSKAKWGTSGYDTKDIGGGQYDILGSTGTKIGTGYKSLYDTIYELNKKNFADPTPGQFWKDVSSAPESVYNNRYDPVYQTSDRQLDMDRLAQAGYRVNESYRPAGNNEYSIWQAASGTPFQQSINGYKFNGGNYDTLEAANLARDVEATKYIRGNATQDWETLGQLLNSGRINGTYTDLGSLGGNYLADPVSGLNTLYGSTPLLMNDKIYGYKQQGNITPMQKSWSETVDGKNTKSWDMGQSALWREYNNPSWWANTNNIKQIGDGNYFITPEKAVETPGWFNRDDLVRNAGSVKTGGGGKVGILGHVFNALDPILDTINPTHDMEQELVRNLGGFDTQQQAFSTVMPMILNYFFPGVGGLVTGADAASRGDSRGVGMGLLNSAISYGGTQFGDTGGAPTTSEAYIDAGGMGGTAAGSNLSGTSGVFGSSVDLGSNFANQMAQNAAISAAQGGLGAAIGGASAGDSMLAALMSGAGNAAGVGVSDLTKGYGSAMSGFLGGATRGAVSSLAQPERMLESSLSGGLGQGLGGLFTQMQNNPTVEQRRGNAQSGQALSKLITTLAKRNNGTTTSRR